LSELANICVCCLTQIRGPFWGATTPPLHLLLIFLLTWPLYLQSPLRIWLALGAVPPQKTDPASKLLLSNSLQQGYLLEVL